MRRASILTWLTLAVLALHGQSFFNIQPDVGGNDMQGVCRNIIIHDSTFSIIGHRYDTTGPGSNSKPWLGEFDYEGNMTFLTPLIDTFYATPFNTDGLYVIHKENDIYYAYSIRAIEPGYYTPYLFELKIKNGSIIKSKLIPNCSYPNLSTIPSDLQFRNNIISLLSYLQVEDSIKIFVTELDTFFVVQDLIEIKTGFGTQFPMYLEYSNDGDIIIIAIVRFINNDGIQYYNFVYIVSDRNGTVVNYKIPPSSRPYTNNLTLAKCVINNNLGNWVFSASEVIDYSDSCLFCTVELPYIFSVSADFDSLLWETRFFDIPYKIGPYYDVYSLTEVEDGYIATAQFRKLDLDNFPDSGVLFKAGLNGDSLWMKHYIPLEWDEYRVVYGRFVDIKTTPSGSVIAAGQISDRDLQIIRPWILHIDKDGCLVPGCNLASDTEDRAFTDHENRFKLYPNPSSSELYLLSAISNTNPVHIQVVSSTGMVIKARDFFPVAGFQYSLPVDDLPPGVYHLILTDKRGNLSESHTFLRN